MGAVAGAVVSDVVVLADAPSVAGTASVACPTVVGAAAEAVAVVDVVSVSLAGTTGATSRSFRSRVGLALSFLAKRLPKTDPRLVFDAAVWVVSV